jgi:hypothetical protein
VSVVKARRFTIPGLTPPLIPKHETECAAKCGALNPTREVELCPVCRALLQFAREHPERIPHVTGRSGMTAMFDAFNEMGPTSIYVLTSKGFEEFGTIHNHTIEHQIDSITKCHLEVFVKD